MKTQMLLKDVAALAGVKPYQITYAISVGHLPEPKHRIFNKRLFQVKDLERIQAHFGVALVTKEQKGGNDGQ